MSKHNLPNQNKHITQPNVSVINRAPKVLKLKRMPRINKWVVRAIGLVMLITGIYFATRPAAPPVSAPVEFIEAQPAQIAQPARFVEMDEQIEEPRRYFVNQWGLKSYRSDAHTCALNGDTFIHPDVCEVALSR